MLFLATSRSCRRLRFGRLAVVAMSSGVEGSWSRYSTSHHAALEVLHNLADRLQEPMHLRSTRATELASTKKSTTTTTSDENRRRSELASELCSLYSDLPPLKLPPSDSCERTNIILFLANDCSPTDNDVLSAIESFKRPAHDGGNTNLSTRLHSATLSNLRRAATPAFEELLEFILKQNTVHGMGFLTALRTDLIQILRWMKKSANDEEMLPRLKDLNAYLLRILSIWFSPGIIELKRITYEETSASIIEMIAKKEAVHPMKSLDDLRSRLGSGRRVFSLFHPVLPDQPLIFVHAALLEEIPSSMSHVMEVPANESPKVAAFYSISNAQPGLAGIGLGEYLLKESVKRLKNEFSSMDTFVTLSPIPGFRKWLEDKLRSNREGGHFYDCTILSEDELGALEQAGLISKGDPWQSFLKTLEEFDFTKQSSSSPPLPTTTDTASAILKPILLRLAGRYLLVEKHRGSPLDAVTRFHVGNGALVYRINFGADMSRKGLKSSFGVMVNYQYDLNNLVENQKQYETNYRIPISDELKHSELLRSISTNSDSSSSSRDNPDGNGDDINRTKPPLSKFAQCQF